MANKEIDIEDAQDKLASTKLSLFGYSFTPTQIGLGFTLLSSIIGMLYGGFVMYQKVEEIANLDIGAFEQRMELIDAKIDNQQKLLQSMESNLNDAKTNMYRLDTKVNEKLDRFERKVDKTKEDLELKMEKYLGNPLND